LFSTFFTAWGYDVSYLEFIASIASFIGVALGITRKRITWPWWALSSILYGLFFLEFKLYASAALQVIFVAAAVIGWYGWEPTGAKPGPVKNSHRIYIVAAILGSTLILGPILNYLGAASTYVDAILFFGSFAAQMLMVYQKYETWPLWLVVDLGYVALYASQGLLFTTLLYALFTIMAALGWRSWYAAHRSAIRSL